MSAATFDDAPAFPAWLQGCLLDRAASLLRAAGVGCLVTFHLVDDDETTAHPFAARLSWSPDEDAPRVLVFDGHTGDFVCRSQAGQPFAIDPARWRVDSLWVFGAQGAMHPVQASAPCVR